MLKFYYYKHFFFVIHNVKVVYYYCNFKCNKYKDSEIKNKNLSHLNK